MEADEHYMRRALALAEKARGATSPNPLVGCVIVRDGAIIGEGFHERAGEPHAEINAIAAAGGDIEGATVFVTLEPCAHTNKRTPPCAPVLAEKRPGRVVAAMADPNPLNEGQGFELLQEAGIRAEVGLLESEARRQNEEWIKYITTGLPWVISKVGMSLDGKIATRTGDSRWVTGETSRRMVHELRNHVDAILVGSRTVVLDDPSLTTRLEQGKIKDPIRVILDSDEYLGRDLKVFSIESASPTWVISPVQREIPGVHETIYVPPAEGAGVDMTMLMRELAKRDVVSVLIEGGGTTHGSAFEAGLVDKVMFFVAPKIIGGREAVTAVAGHGAERMQDAVLLEDMQATPVGEDILIEAYVKKT